MEADAEASIIALDFPLKTDTSLMKQSKIAAPKRLNIEN